MLCNLPEVENSAGTVPIGSIGKSPPIAAPTPASNNITTATDPSTPRVFGMKAAASAINAVASAKNAKAVIAPVPPTAYR